MRRLVARVQPNQIGGQLSDGVYFFTGFRCCLSLLSDVGSECDEAILEYSELNVGSVAANSL
jgi:hypothetical protein